MWDQMNGEKRKVRVFGPTPPSTDQDIEAAQNCGRISPIILIQAALLSISLIILTSHSRFFWCYMSTSFLDRLSQDTSDHTRTGPTRGRAYPTLTLGARRAFERPRFGAGAAGTVVSPAASWSLAVGARME